MPFHKLPNLVYPPDRDFRSARNFAVGLSVISCVSLFFPSLFLTHEPLLVLELDIIESCQLWFLREPQKTFSRTRNGY